MLDNFSTVSEASEGFKQIQVISAKASNREWPVHLSIADKNGDSAVIELIKGKTVITRGPSTVVMTIEPPFISSIREPQEVQWLLRQAIFAWRYGSIRPFRKSYCFFKDFART